MEKFVLFKMLEGIDITRKFKIELASFDFQFKKNNTKIKFKLCNFTTCFPSFE